MKEQTYTHTRTHTFVYMMMTLIYSHILVTLQYGCHCKFAAETAMRV